MRLTISWILLLVVMAFIWYVLVLPWTDEPVNLEFPAKGRHRET